jgi:dTDP-4-amino-4,6-dideoxygalactose transaminase
MNAEARMPAIEDTLKSFMDCQSVSLVGSGTTAIIVALWALRLPPGAEVIVPSMCCPAVPLAVAFTGAKPVFADVELSDFNLSIASVKKVCSPRTHALVLVHAFGQPASADVICEWARQANLKVIDDAAQAFGGEYHGRRLGTWGDIGITSFGRSKILDVGQGGAIFTNNSALATDVAEITKELKPLDLRKERVGVQVFKRLHRLERLPWARLGLYRIVPYVARHFRGLFLFRIDLASAYALAEHLPQMEMVLEARRHHAALCRQNLHSPGIVHPSYIEAGGIPWMYSFRILCGLRDRVKTLINRNGYRLDSLYSVPGHWLYGSHVRLGNTERLAREIANLNVSERMTASQLITTTQEITLAVDQLRVDGQELRGA